VQWQRFWGVIILVNMPKSDIVSTDLLDLLAFVEVLLPLAGFLVTASFPSMKQQMLLPRGQCLQMGHRFIAIRPNLKFGIGSI